MPLSARSTTKIKQLCINGHTNEITISTLLRGVSFGPMSPGDPDVVKLAACPTCSVIESLRIDQAQWTAAQKATLAGRRRAAALWLVRKLNVDDQWTSAGLKALCAAETDPPDMAADPAGAAFEPV
jgi:hypothetical protein